MQGLRSAANPLKILAYQQREALQAGTEVLQPAATRTRPAKHWLVITPARRNIVQVTRPHEHTVAMQPVLTWVFANSC